MSPTLPPTAATRYACVGCGARWRYDQVRVIACCRACGGGLWALDREERVGPPSRDDRHGP